MALTPGQQAELDAYEAKMNGSAADRAAAPQSTAAPPNAAGVESIGLSVTHGAPPADQPPPSTADPMAAAAVPTGSAALAPGVAAISSAVAPDASLNPEHEKLPDWMQLPELQLTPAQTLTLAVDPAAALSMPQVRALLATSATGAGETKRILEKLFPKVEIKQDGRYLVMKSENGEKYAWKPGLRSSDAVRAALGALVAAPAAAAAAPVAGAGFTGARVLGGALSGLGGAATQEALQAAHGGTFDLGQVALAAGLGGAIPMAGKAFSTTKGLLFGAAPEAEAAAQAAARPMNAQDLGPTMLDAARGNASAAAKVAAQAKPDPELLAAAQRQGLASEIHPDQASTSPAFQQVSQAIPGAAERHAATVDAIRQNVERLVSNAGGDVDRSMLQNTIKTGVEKQMVENDALTKQLYKTAGDAIPKDAPTPAAGLLAEIDNIAAGRRGAELPPILKKLRAAAAPKDGVEPTWSDIDALTKELGAAKGRQGAFKKLEPGMASHLYPILDADRQLTAERFNVGQTFRDAQAAYKTADSFEKGAASAFGKESANALDRVGSSVKVLAGGNPDPFVKVITAAPEALRPQIAESSVLSVFGKDMSAADAVKWFDGLERSKGSYNALMTYLSPETREGLKDSITILRGITRAASQKGLNAKAVFPEKSGFVKGLLALGAGAGVHAAGAAAEHVTGVPIPSGTISAFVTMKMLMPKTPALEALKDFVTSPAGRIALDHAAGGAPLPVGRLASIAASPAFQRLMTAANIAPSARQNWLEQALTTTAAGSPARAGATQQPEEGK